MATTRAVVAGLVFAIGCSSHAGGQAGDDGGGPPGTDAGSGSGNLTLRDRQRALAMALRGNPNFMIGVGNDNSGPYDHAVPMDLHYAYLDGYGDEGGWPTWNTDGDYPLFFAQTDTGHAVSSMFTYYQLALELENKNDAVFADATRMHQYLSDVKLLFQRISDSGKPAVVQFEPDFFGYLMQRAAPDTIAVRVHFDDLPDCAALPETAIGLTQCMVALGRATSPSTMIGFHASEWGAYYDPTDPNADIAGSGVTVAKFLRTMGADATDFVSVETLDRDAGFWETSGGGATCSLTGGSRGAVYWDETTASLPNFDQHLQWVTALTGELQRPAIEWQTPLGVPSPTCGGTADHWRDNRVHYFFGHVSDLVNAGIAGMTFGTGAGGQTTLDTDGDQLKTASMAYMAAPFAM
jgi:hypothetical protein